MKPWADPEVLAQVEQFYAGLSEDSADAFDAAVEKLAEIGPTLGRPIVGEIDTRDYPKAQQVAHLKELRPLGTTIRVLFTFGPDRIPVLLVAGDKAGQWKAWYPAAIKEAGRELAKYLEDISGKA